MIWLTWRQHRQQALFTALALAALAALMVPTGLHMRGVFDDSGLASCLDKVGTAPLVPQGTDTCDALRDQFVSPFGGTMLLAILFVLLPLLVGLFFGAPLVAREIESGAHRMVWTQGVSRRQWVLAKTGLLGTAALLLAVVYALGVTWWFAPMAASSTGRLAYGYFDVQGIVPIGYTLFALALGVFAGTVCRKVLPAMAVTLGGFTVVRLGIELLARPHYLPGKTLSYGVQSTEGYNPASGVWASSTGVYDAGGKLVSNGFVGCSLGSEGDACVQEMGGPDSYNQLVYQPGDRFWIFQGIETGIFLVLTALLLYLAIRRIRRIA
ncbi:ABC transporter permease [Streptomyces sp. NPDC058195]|uniref:ABC transporter permease n=1 Tax=Streptomyces sp. NPDC058195 TaxID=3346375 RepID=UPI0036EB96AB